MLLLRVEPSIKEKPALVTESCCEIIVLSTSSAEIKATKKTIIAETSGRGKYLTYVKSKLSSLISS